MSEVEQLQYGISGETPPRMRVESPSEFKSPNEEILLSREKTSSRKIGGGVTDSSFVELKDDGKGVFKTESYQNERAAYLIDRFLSINLTPPTAIRVLDGQTGSIQEFIPDAKTLYDLRVITQSEEEKFCEEHKEEFIKMWVFDLIIGNFDRHGGNFLFRDNSLHAIDHGFSFNYHLAARFTKKIDTDLGYRSFFNRELPSDFVEKIKRFLENPEYQQILEDLLAELLGEDYALACLKRIRVIGKMVIETGRLNKETLSRITL